MSETNASQINDSATDDSLSCVEFLHSRIRIANTISFREFMQSALYHSNGGYYATQATRVGKDGDFFTSVSVGQCFGKILAYRIHQLWQEMKQPANFHLIELGANNASLCIDILKELQALEPDQPFSYHIVEPLEALQAVQKQHISEQGLAPVIHHSDFKEVKDLTGIFLSNELIDAFPVEVIKLIDGAWLQMHVMSDGKNFSETWEQIRVDNAELMEFTEGLGTDFPEGYLTEFRPELRPFLKQASEAIEKGMMLVIDYGFPRSHLYHKSRTEGTLQTYLNHEKDDQPLLEPGSRDISTHIDFTHFTELAQESGFELYDFSPQHRHLTHYGSDWLKSLEANFTPEVIPLVKQFQTLTHPGMMGQQFHMLEMTKGIELSSPPTTDRPEEVLEIEL